MTSPGRDRTRERVVEMFLAGAAFSAIADAVGLAGGADEAKTVVAEEMRSRSSTQGQVVAAEIARLDALLTAVWPHARKGDPAAIDMALKISDRRIKAIALLPESAATETSEPGVSTPLDELNRRRAARGSGASRKGVAKVAPH